MTFDQKMKINEKKSFPIWNVVFGLINFLINILIPELGPLALSATALVSFTGIEFQTDSTDYVLMILNIKH